jgi:hypothetical protein
MQQAAAAADLDPGAAAASSAGPKDRQLGALEALYVHSVYDAIDPTLRPPALRCGPGCAPFWRRYHLEPCWQM